MKDRVSVDEMWMDDQDSTIHTVAGYGRYGGTNRDSAPNQMEEFFAYREYLAEAKRSINRLRSAEVTYFITRTVSRSRC